MALTVKINGDASGFEKTLSSVEKSIGSLGMGNLGANFFGNLGANLFSNVSGALSNAVKVGLQGAFDFAKGSSKAAADMEDLEMRLSTVLGSSKKAKEMIALFREEATKSALGTEDYAEAAQLLAQYGVEGEDLIQTLKRIADVSLGNSDRFSGLSLAFAQVVSRGKLMAEEMNQMTERGFNPLKEISRVTGIEMSVLMETMKDGGVTARDVAIAFQTATSKGGMFFNAIEKGSGTTNAKIAQLEDQYKKLQITFGKGFNLGLVNALDIAGVKLEQLGPLAETIGKNVGFLITDIVNGDYQRIGKEIGDGIVLGLQLTLESAAPMLVGAFAHGFVQAFHENLQGMIRTMTTFGIPELARGVGLGELADQMDSYYETLLGAPLKAWQNADKAGGEQSVTNITQRSLSTGKSNIQEAFQKFEERNREQQAIYLQKQIADGVKNGIDMSMSREVREGVLEAWSRQSQKSTFTN